MRPNNGYGKFAAWTLFVTVLFIGAAEVCGIIIDRGTAHVTLLRIAGLLSLSIGLAAFAVLLLATYVHILNCRTLRRLYREKSQDDSINNHYQPNQKNKSNED